MSDKCYMCGSTTDRLAIHDSRLEWLHCIDIVACKKRLIESMQPRMCIKDKVRMQLEPFFVDSGIYGGDKDLLRAEMAQLSDRVCEALGISEEEMLVVGANIVVVMADGVAT